MAQYQSFQQWEDEAATRILDTYGPNWRDINGIVENCRSEYPYRCSMCWKDLSDLWMVLTHFNSKDHTRRLWHAQRAAPPQPAALPPAPGFPTSPMPASSVRPQQSVPPPPPVPSDGFAQPPAPAMPQPQTMTAPPPPAIHMPAQTESSCVWAGMAPHPCDAQRLRVHAGMAERVEGVQVESQQPSQPLPHPLAASKDSAQPRVAAVPAPQPIDASLQPPSTGESPSQSASICGSSDNVLNLRGCQGGIGVSPRMGAWHERDPETASTQCPVNNLHPGLEVRICGLRGKLFQHLNNAHGVIICNVSNSSRWLVELGEDTEVKLALCPENLMATPIHVPSDDSGFACDPTSILPRHKPSPVDMVPQPPPDVSMCQAVCCFDSSGYGPQCLSISKGDRLERLEHSAENENWAFVRLSKGDGQSPQNRPHEGWVPKAFLGPASPITFCWRSGVGSASASATSEGEAVLASSDVGWL